MTPDRTHATSPRKPLRLWPGVITVALQWLTLLALPILAPDARIAGILAPFAAGLVVVVWWVFFSRALWSERVGAIVLMIVAVAVTSRVLHPSIATSGQGMLFFFKTVPVLSLAFVVWAVASRHLADSPRRLTMAATLLFACGGWALLRSDGLTGEGALELRWRWAKTAEQRLLARMDVDPTPDPAASPELSEAIEAEWPGFRGPGRNGVVPGVAIATDWSKSRPVELWRRKVGPGISSFAVHGDLLYTQEQRGDHESVACYHATTGELVWRHLDETRFWDSHVGAGPHSTPTLSGGRVYTFGATGILNALDAADGAVVWSRNVASELDRKVPYWGFSSSPLVVDDAIIVSAAAQLVAYDADTGDRRWSGPVGGFGHSSPHLLTIDGVAQVLLLSAAGATSVAPGDGTLLWQYPWRGTMYVQPGWIAGGNLLLSAADEAGGVGMRRITVARGAARGAGGWTAEERWTSARLKPYFSDFVVHNGHAYGFDGRILAAIDIENGERQWKGGRYGHGQLVLLPDQNMLLVLSEKGELALVGATPDAFTEHARLAVLSGKTWNHPVLVGDLLLVRNREEMAAFRLPLARG
ncbi:MAG: PQQ-binding-like beta-propeller repeat protein [Acidobacteriota bacterium]